MFGLPQCRYCRQTMHDWVSMERHNHRMSVSQTKTFAAAEGKTVEHVMQMVYQEEQATPPKPPMPSTDIEATPRDIASCLLTCPLSQLPVHTEEIAQLKTRCILCAQVIKVYNRMHCRAPEACEPHLRPCQFCGSTAIHGTSDTTHHATKCSPPFQVLAARKLHAAGVLDRHLSSRRGPAQKQRGEGGKI